MVDKVAKQTEVQKVNVNQDSNPRGCEEKDKCLTLGGLADEKSVEKGLSDKIFKLCIVRCAQIC